MKRLIILSMILISSLIAKSQTFTPRTNGTFTPVDPYLSVPRALYIPKVCDTLGTPLHGGKDTIGAIIFDTCNHKFYVRDGIGAVHRWTNINISGDSTIFSTNYRRDTALANVRLHYEKVYNIVEFGAKGDGKENYNASMSPGSPILTCATCGFTSADIGKWIRVYRAVGTDLVTTISGFTNSTTVTLANSATNTVSGDTIIYGTDNVPAIKSALTLSNTNGGDAKVIIPPPGYGKFYVLAGTLDHSGSDCNCQINIPISDILDTSFNNRKHLVIDGLMPPNHTPSALYSDTLTAKQNTTLISIIHGSGTRPAIFAAKANSFLYANYINYNMITVKNLAVFVERNRAGGGPDIGVFNFYNASSSPMENIVAGINGPIHGTQQPTNECAAIIVGQLSAEIYTSLKNVSVFGFKYGLVTTESVSLDHVIAHSNVNGITIIHGNYPTIGVAISAHWNKNSINIPSTTILGDISPGLAYFDFQTVEMELFDPTVSLGQPSWMNYDYVVNDPGDYGRGYLKYHIGKAGVGVYNSLFNKNGGDSIFCYQIGSQVDNNPHIYSNVLQFAGGQNGGATSVFYNWSPISDANIMRLSPLNGDASQALYLSGRGTGGSGLPMAWINIFNTPFWSAINTASGDNELLQVSANGASGYKFKSAANGTGSVRDIEFLTGSNAGQLYLSAANKVFIGKSTDASTGIFQVQSNTAQIAGFVSSASSHASFSIGAASGFNTNFVYKNGSTNVWYVQNNDGEGNAYKIFNSDANGNAEKLSLTQAGALKINNAFTLPTSDGTNGQVLQTDGAGSLSFALPAMKYSHSIFTPATGGTVNLVNKQYNIINPSGTIATLTVNLPSSPSNNDAVYIKYTQAVTAVTYGNGTVVDGITAPTAGGLVILVYDSGTSSWY